MLRILSSVQRRFVRETPIAHVNAQYGMSITQKIGQQLRQRRKFLRLRQRDLAELADVSLRGLTKIENGTANPTISQLAKIAGVLGLEITFVERNDDAES